MYTYDDIIDKCGNIRTIKLFVTTKDIEDACIAVLGEENFKLFSSQVLAFVSKNNDMLTTKEVTTKMNLVTANASNKIHGILIYLAYMGKLHFHQSEDGDFRWGIINWSDNMTDETMRRAVDERIEDAQNYEGACHVTTICIVPDLYELIESIALNK